MPSTSSAHSVAAPVLVGAIDCTVPGEMPFAIKVAGASTTNFEPGIYPEIKVDGFSVDAGPLGTGSLAQFLLKTIDFNPTLDALESAVIPDFKGSKGCL